MSERVRLPDLAMIGWIPFYRSTHDMPVGHEFPRSSAVNLLLQSGNPSPNGGETFASSAALENWLDARTEFRGAASVREASIEWRANGEPVLLGAVTRFEVGYTAMPWAAHAGVLPANWRYWRGEGSATKLLIAVAGRDTLLFKYTVRIKIGWILDRVTRGLFTRKWAPNAIMSVQGEVRRDGATTIQFVGSCIPSQGFYLNGKLVPSATGDFSSPNWRMEGSKGEQIHDFLYKPENRCEDAEVFPRYIWQERLPVEHF